jgi:hypothetical protein
MVTKPTGRPRGRPRKPPKPKRPRRRKTLLPDPDRYILASAIAIQVALKKTEKEAVRMAVFESVTQRFDPASFWDQRSTDMENERRMKKAVRFMVEEQKKAAPGYFTVMSQWPRENYTEDGGPIDTRPHCHWQNVESRVRTITKKLSKYSRDKEARKWLVKMSAAFAVPLGRKFNPIWTGNIAAAKHFALWKAREVCEQETAEHCILPMIDRAAGIWTEAPPDFSLIFGPPT